MNFKQIWNYGLSTLSAIDKSQRCLGLPVHLTVEPTNICNLRCPVCETGAGVLERPKGMLSLSNFKRMLDTVGSQVNTLLLYYMGESFLNKDLPQMISYAVGKGIYVSVCTNGEPADAVGLIGSQVSEVNFQIGGMSQRTHGIYRKGGELGLTLYNLRQTLAERCKRQSTARVNVGFIVMKHNEHEIGRLQELKALGVDEVQVIAPCVRTVKQGKEFLPTSDKYWYYDRKAFNRGVLVPKVIPHDRCWWIYYSTVITWDGQVLPCCRDAHGKHVMGNVFKNDFAEIWNGEEYRHFRDDIANWQSRISICRLCSGYGMPRLY